MNGNKPLYEYPQAEAIKETIENVAQTIYSNIEGYGSTLEPSDTEEVEHKHRDGFFPYTDGGYIKWSFAGIDAMDTKSMNSVAWPDVLRSQINNLSEQNFLDCVNAARREADKEELVSYADALTLYRSGSYYDVAPDVKQWLFLPGFEGNTARKAIPEIWTEEEQNTFEMACLDSQDQTLYGIKVWCLYYENDNEDGQTVCFMVSINTDFEYYRRSVSWIRAQVEFDLYEKSFPLNELTPEKLTEIQAEMIAAF